MRLFLDTHTFLWSASDPGKLSQPVRESLLSNDHELFVSTAGLWEMAIKFSIGRLGLKPDYTGFIDQTIQDIGAQVLGIHKSHLDLITALPFHHRDPFDRLSIAQTIVENLTVLSRDEVFDTYGVTRLW